MFCTNCGNRIDNDSKYCCHCGRKTEQSDINSARTNYASNAQNRNNPYCYAPRPAPAKKTNGFAVAGFVLALISVIITVIYSVSDYHYVDPHIFLSGFGSYVFTCLIFSVLGLNLSILGTVKSKTLGSGKGLGITGIVLSSLILFFWLFVLFIVFIVLFGFSIG